MLFVPLPFVVALLLLLLFAAVARRDGEVAVNWAFLLLILACALQSFLTGLRWGYGMEDVRYVMPVIAAALPPLVYFGVRRLIQTNTRHWPTLLALHALPPLTIALLVVFYLGAVDWALIVIYLVYAIGLLQFLSPGPDMLRLAPFEGAARAHRAAIFAAFVLCLSALADALVLLDFAWTHGTHAAMIISIANLLGLLILGIAAAAASQSRTPPESVESSIEIDLAEDTELLAEIDLVMRQKRSYCDANLNLDRLARKVGVPARRISTAINRLTGKNVSQFVNDYRIGEACRLLSETDYSVTHIMLEAGFQTKSNFNREFRRLTGVNPVTWRAGKRDTA